MPAAQLNPGMIAAKQVLKAATITPAACQAIADTSARIPNGATYAAGQSISAADHTASAITAMAVKDPGTLITQALPTGQTQTILPVTGIKGTLGATAVKTGADVTADSTAELVKLVDAVLG